MRYARKLDANHRTIVDALRGVGAEVKELYQFPTCLDVIAGYRGHLFWADIKNGKGELTPAERALIEAFARVGVTLYVWRSAEDALKTIGAIE